MPNELIGNGAVILRTQRGSKEETGVDIMVGVDNLETERSILKGRIEMEQQLVNKGRLNVEVLEESKLKFEV